MVGGPGNVRGRVAAPTRPWRSRSIMFTPGNGSSVDSGSPILNDAVVRCALDRGHATPEVPVSDTDQAAADDPAVDPHMLAHPQEGYAMLRGVAPVMPMDNVGIGVSDTMVLVAGEAEVREVLKHPEVYSSGIDAVHIGQIRPLIPLQIDPPDHKKFRKILDPLFAPKQVAAIEDRHPCAHARADRRCGRPRRVQLPLRPSPSRCPPPSSSSSWGCRCPRRKEFIELKDGIIRPPAHDHRGAPRDGQRHRRQDLRRAAGGARGAGGRARRTTSSPAS